MPGRPRIDPVEFERRLRTWAELTELGLAMRGSVILGDRRARSWKACVRAGLSDANRRRLEKPGG